MRTAARLHGHQRALVVREESSNMIALELVALYFTRLCIDNVQLKYILSDIHSHDRQIYGRFHGGVSSSCSVNELLLWHIDAVAARPQSDLMPTMAVRVETSIPSEIFISTLRDCFRRPEAPVGLSCGGG